MFLFEEIKRNVRKPMKESLSTAWWDEFYDTITDESASGEFGIDIGEPAVNGYDEVVVGYLYAKDEYYDALSNNGLDAALLVQSKDGKEFPAIEIGMELCSVDQREVEQLAMTDDYYDDIIDESLLKMTEGYSNDEFSDSAIDKLDFYIEQEFLGHFPAPGLWTVVCDWFSDHEQAAEDLVHYIDRYVNDDSSVDECLTEANVKGREVDLTNKEKTIAYALRQPENSDKLNKILNDVAARTISFSDGVRKCQELINSLENVSDSQKKNAYVSISHAKTPNHLMSIMGTYLTGDKVISGRKSYK